MIRNRIGLCASFFALVTAYQVCRTFGQTADITQANGLNGTLSSATDTQKPEHQNWAIHFEAIEVFQGQPGFKAAYSGTNSLFPGDNFRQTSEVDLFFGLRLWPGAEFYFNPEYYQGFGLGITHGIGDFPNSMAYKTGKYRGDVNIPHLFIRQVIGFGGEKETLEPDQLQLAGQVDISRLTIQFGRMAVTDLFDNNAFAHNPIHQE